MNFPPKTILVPFDFSDASFAAWTLARELANRFDASLIALHVYEWTAAPVELPPLPLSLEEKRKLKERLAGAVGPDVTLRFGEGGIVQELLKAADETKTDLIVMATAGRAGLKRLARDSVTENVVRRSPIPVLAVHGKADLPQSILAPLNGRPYSLPGLTAAAAWAKALGADLTALYVHEDSDERSGVMTRVDLRERTRLAKPGAHLVLDQGEPVDRILEAAPGHGLLVLVAHRKGLLRDAVLGTTAEQVLRRSPSPVLTIPGAASSRATGLKLRLKSRKRLAARRKKQRT